MPHFIREFG
jgi:hypothetical protein